MSVINTTGCTRPYNRKFNTSGLMSKAKARKASHAEASSSQVEKHDFITRITFTQALMQRVCMLEDDAKELYKNLMQTKNGEEPFPTYKGGREYYALKWLAYHSRGLRFSGIPLSDADAGYPNLVGEIEKEVSFCNFRLGRLLFPVRLHALM